MTVHVYLLTPSFWLILQIPNKGYAVIFFPFHLRLCG